MRRLIGIGLTLLCTGLLTVTVAVAGDEPGQAKDMVQPASTVQLSNARAAQSAVDEKPELLPESIASEFAEQELEHQGKPEEEPVADEWPTSLWPVEQQGEFGAWRYPCFGDKDIDGAGTTNWGYTLNVYYKSRRSTSIYLASQFNCSDGGPISGIRYYVSQVPAMSMPNLTIRLRHTTASVYTSPYCFNNDGWTICYQATTQITQTGWYTFTFTTPFNYNGVDNLEVDVSFGQNPTYNNSGQVWSFSAGTGNNRTIYAYSDTYANPWNWTCGTGNPTVYGSIQVPRVQFIFPPPTVGACCFPDYSCADGMSEGDCLAAGGIYRGDGSTCVPNPCYGACCYNYPDVLCVNASPEECTALGGSFKIGNDCTTPGYYCPPWNDNCGAVTPVTLDPGVPVQFTGTNLGATNDCGLFAGGQVWHAITLPSTYAYWKVTLDYCGSLNTSGGPFGNAWLNWAIGCPCSSVTAAGTYDTVTCGDGNITIQWASLTAGTYYYPVLLDVANNAAGDYVLNVVAVPTYCASGATSTADETLKEFSFVNIYNYTTDCDKYDDFTYISTDVIAGSTYPFSAIIGDCEGTSCYSKWLTIFIDLNQDYDFDDAGEKVWTSGQLGNTPCPDFPVSGNITIPPTATVGCTRMRVIVKETTTEPTPCGTYTWGATEDYTVCILPPPPQGACCFGMTCTPDMYQLDCENAGGVYQGDGTTCEPVNPCIGACCFNDGSCVETANEADCVALGGTFKGNGTDCDPNLCPQPGDDCTLPKQITLLPGGIIVDTDTTCGRRNDYADTCLGYYDGGEDIIYELTLPEDMCVKISVDGVLTWVGVAIDYNCPPGASCLAYATSSAGDPVIGDLNLTAGVYYIMIDTWPSPTCTGFTLTVKDCQCTVACPPGAIEEPEPCGQDTNGGCNSTPPAFTPIACGDVICGTIWADTSLRDTDWYQMTTTGWNKFTWTAIAECPVLIFIIKGAGPNDCSSYTIVGNTSAAECTLASLTTTSQPPGTYWFFVAPSDWQDWPCPKDYVASLTCTPSGPEYCAAGSTYTNCDEYIARVQIGTIDNSSGCSQPGGYGDYTYLSTDLQYGVPVPMIVTNGKPIYSLDVCRVWIDWNQDYNFTADEIIGTVPGVGPYNFTVTAPVTALTGPTRMRIRIDYNNADPPACGYRTYGEVEDYTVNVVEVEGACCHWDGTCTIELPSTCFDGVYTGPFTSCSGLDCNENGMDDYCDIAFGFSIDCNFNGIPDECEPLIDCNGNGQMDECDIIQGISEDCQPNGIPDECDVDPLDPDGNGEVSEDCQFNGIPDECELGGKGPRHTYILDDGTHEDAIGLTNGGYVAWMNRFIVVPNANRIGKVLIAYGMVNNGTPLTVYIWSDPNQDGNPTDGQVLASAPAVVANSDQDVFNEVPIGPVDVGPAGTSFFVGAIIQHPAGQYPCSIDMTASQHQSWIAGDSSVPIDPNNMGAASLPPLNIDTYFPGNWLIRAESAAGGDCNNNGVPDECDVPPICEGPECSQDCQPDLIPDECQLEGNDCNQNGRPDDCDIASGFSEDCQPDGIPDECQLEGNDCNENGVPDDCDLANGTSQDCNDNDIPDECDIASGLSCDCQGDGVPDECQLFTSGRIVIWDNGPLATGTGCGGEISVLQDSLGLGTYGWGAQQSASNRIADDFTLETACQIETITVYTYQTGSTPPTITSVVMQIWNGPPNAGGTVIWGDLTTNRLQSCTASNIYRTLPTVDCSRHIQKVVATVGVQLEPGTYWIDYSFAGTGASGPWAPPVTILGQTGKPGANALQYLGSSGAWGAVLDGDYPQDFPFIVEGQCGAPPNDCNENGIPDECDIGVQWGGYCAGQGGDCFPPTCASDWNGNGVPDSCELCGDIDEDGDVDIDDYWAFQAAFGCCVNDPPPCSYKYNPLADMDGDGCVTLADYRAWRMCYKMANGKEFVAPKIKPVQVPASNNPQSLR